MDFLDHSMNPQQTGNNKIIMVNGDNKAYSQSNDLNTTEPMDNKGPELRVYTNNTSNCNNSDNYKNPTSTYNIVSSGITTPIHSACVSPDQSLQTNMQIPVLTNQSIFTSVQAQTPQSLTQVQIQQLVANAEVMQPQLQQTQPVINVLQNLNSSIQPQSIQHIQPVNQHIPQKMPQQYPEQYEHMSPGNVQQQIMQPNMPAQLNKSFVSQKQSFLYNCAPIQQSVNQMLNQQVPQYYNAPPIQSQHFTSESSTAVSMSNQQQFQSIPVQNHVQLHQIQQQLPPHMQQHPSPPYPQQQQQTPQQMQEVGQQLQGPQGSQIQHNSQQTHRITQLSQMTNQPQQIPQSNQIENQMQQITLQTQLEHPKQMQTTQIQPQSQQIPQQQQQISQNQMVCQNNQQIYHIGQIIPQKHLNEGQQFNQQNQQVQQQQQLQKIQQQMSQTSHPSQPTSQQILQSNQYMPQQNQVLTQHLEISHSYSKMSIPQSQNQQVIQPRQSQDMQQAGQQYQQIMQSQPQRLPMQNNQPIMHQPTYSQGQRLNAMQLQQVAMQIPSNTVTSTQMHIQQQQPVVQSNMMQQPKNVPMPQNNIQPAISISQQQTTYSMQQHVPINQNCVDSLINSTQNCYIPSQQQMDPSKLSMITVETVNKKKEDSNIEDVDDLTVNTVPIDIKIEQTIDLLKSHLMYAVCEEVEELKDNIAELMNTVRLLEIENSNLRKLVPPDMLE